MKALAALISMLSSCVALCGTTAIAQSAPQPTIGRGSDWVNDASVDSFVFCSVAQNAGTMRWLMALRGDFGSDLPVRPELLEGARAAALRHLFFGGCQGDAKMPPAAIISKLDFLMGFHPESSNASRRSDALADCFASKHPSEAMKYLEDYDRSFMPGGKRTGAFVDTPDTPQILLSEFFGAKSGGKPIVSGCAAEFNALFKDRSGGDSFLSMHDFYVRTNWLLRAQPYFDRNKTRVTSAASMEVQ